MRLVTGGEGGLHRTRRGLSLVGRLTRNPRNETSTKKKHRENCWFSLGYLVFLLVMSRYMVPGPNLDLAGHLEIPCQQVCFTEITRILVVCPVARDTDLSLQILMLCFSQELDLSNPNTFRDLSRPMGAQTPDRLKQFEKRYVDWDDPTGSKIVFCCAAGKKMLID